MTTTRRHFLKTCGILGTGAAVSAVVPSLAQASRGKQHKVRQTRLQMGTIVTITALHTSTALVQEAVGRAFEEISHFESLFSRYDSASPVSILNQQGKVSGIPVALADVISRAQRIGSLSDNAFDITVQPLVELFHARQNPQGTFALDKKEFAYALSLVDHRGVTVTGDSITLAREGMGITLDGIAKGYIVDKASELLAANGVTNHMINAGGDIRTMGANYGKPWKIAIEDPQKAGNYPAVLNMYTGAVATSGGYEVFYDKERMFHHLISPTSGKSPNNVASVSVSASSVMEADALATAVFIKQLRQGAQFINSLPGRECLIVTKDGKQFASPHWG